MKRVILITALLLSCNQSAEDVKLCIPGEARPCACLNGQHGRQLCARDGKTLQSCECKKPKEVKKKVEVKPVVVAKEKKTPQPAKQETPIKIVSTSPEWCDDWCGKKYLGTASYSVLGGDGNTRTRKNRSFSLNLGYRKKDGKPYRNYTFGYDLSDLSFILAIPKNPDEYSNVTLAGNKFTVTPNASFPMEINITKTGNSPKNRILTGTIIEYRLLPVGKYEQLYKIEFSAGFRER